MYVMCIIYCEWEIVLSRRMQRLDFFSLSFNPFWRLFYILTMSDLHELCYLRTRPITREVYVEPMIKLLKAGIPATYTIEEVANYEKGEETTELESTTTPMHLICESIPNDATEEEEKVILEMMEQLWLFGAGWCLTNNNDETPGCVLLRRGFHGSKYWDSCVDSGVRAEILLRKIEESNIEFIDVEQTPEQVLEEPKEQPEEAKDEQEEEQVPELVSEEAIAKAKQMIEDEKNDPSVTTSAYLKTKLEYKDGALVTEDRADGVMMQWEDILMQAGCDSMFKSIEDPEDINVLNIGFGMGIIDTMIEEKKPTKHYISEAHPDVLAKLKADGWYEKPNVVILEGKWQDTLPELLSQGIFFDGIYYDTYSEHYEDMVNDLFDVVVGLLKPQGVFSFFNGLGADRLVCYEVYKKVVDIDLANYGLIVKFREIEAPKSTLEAADKSDKSVWNSIKRAYWRCPVYYHPEAQFIQ